MLVCRGPMRMSLAFEFRLGDAILGGCIPTVLAAIRCVPGVDLNPGAPSIVRFGAQNRDELAPVNGHLGIRLRGQGFSGLVDRSYSGWVPVGW